MAVSLTGRFLFMTVRQARRLVGSTDSLRCLNDLLAGASAQRLQLFQRKVLSHEACRAIREGEVGAARMAAAECAGPILHREAIRRGRRLVVDLRGGVQRDVCHGAAYARDETPPSQRGHGSDSGQDNRLEQIKLGIVMEALAEEERLTAAVGDLGEANGAVDEEDAVPRDARKIGWRARRNRALAGVAAVAAHPIEPPGPRRGERGVRCGHFHDAFRQWIRRTQQDLDDLGLNGVCASRDVVTVIVVVPPSVQVVLFEVEEQLDPQIDAVGWYASHVDGRTCARGKLLVDIVIVLRGQAELPHVIETGSAAGRFPRGATAGKSMATKRPMIAITTSSSISVIPLRVWDTWDEDMGQLTSVTY